jgi:hypothetical protein
MLISRRDDPIGRFGPRRYVANFKFAQAELAALHSRNPHWEPEFIEYLAALDTSQVQHRSPSIVFISSLLSTCVRVHARA